MSTMTRSTDTSVTFSLAELAKLEEERVREEDGQRARAREQEARQRREAEARRRAAEAESVAADAAARARRQREEAEERARLEARARAASEVARIEAEARARLDADNAARAHELALVKARAEGGSRRLQHGLAAILALVVCAGSVAAYAATREVAGLEQETQRLREGQLALTREREQARANELATLDRRHGALRARPVAPGGEEARAAADAARGAIDPRLLDQERLRAFADALDALEARQAVLGMLAELDRRHADLGAWAAERRRSDAAAAARIAAARARAAGADPAAIRGYEAALDQLRDALAAPAPAGRPRPAPVPGITGTCGGPGDPMCGLDGRPL